MLAVSKIFQNKQRRGFIPLDKSFDFRVRGLSEVPLLNKKFAFRSGYLTGFTLVEFAIALVIVGIMVSLVVMGLNTIGSKNRDTKRISDIGRLQTALELYFSRNDSYPSALTSGQPLVSSNGKTFLAAVPTAPGHPDGSCTTDTYTYTQDAGGASYHITYCLGGAVQNLSAGNLAASPGSLGTPVAAASTALTVKVLVVAGGGGGASGGGGAGGLVYHSAYSVTAGNSYTVTVGAGGSGRLGLDATNHQGQNGSNSVFDTITAIGGGGGGTNVLNYSSGTNGGSGGGGTYTGTAGWTNAGGTKTQTDSGGGTGYGNNGGSNTIITSYYPAGGGGGAGAVGQNAVSTTEAGDGGAGRINDITGSTAGQNVSGTYYLAGGGGGATYQTSGYGTGGNGGGGNGSSTGTGVAGTANTGGGGGGGAGNASYYGGAGGSGVVVVSYVTGTMTATGGTITTSGGNTIHTFTTSGTSTFAIPSATETADLTGLALSGTPTNYTFSGSTYTYSSVAVDSAVSSITVTPTGSGTITVDGTPVTSGQASGAIALTLDVQKTITVVATETGKTAKTYTIYVTRQSIPTSGLVAHWLMDGNSNDAVGAYNGTDYNMTYVTDGTSQAANFNGSSSYVDYGDVLDMGTNGQTINLWMKSSSTPSGIKGIINKSKYASEVGRYWIALEANVDNHLEIGCANGAVDTHSNALYPYYDNLWHMVTGIWNRAGNMSLYVDNEYFTGTSISAFSASDWQTADKLFFGVFNDTNGTSPRASTYFNGRLDEVLFYNRVLTTAEMKTVFENQKTTYFTAPTGTIANWNFEGDVTDSVGSYNGTASNISYVATGTNQTASFNGSSSMVTIARTANLEPATAVTVSTWVKLNSLTCSTCAGGMSGAYLVFKKNAFAQYFEGYTLLVNSSKFSWSISTGNSGSAQSAVALANASINTWYHVVGTFDRPTMKLYINGVYQSTASHDYNISYDTGVGMFLGRTNNAGFDGLLNGYLDDTKVYTRALSATEVLNLYNLTKGNY